MSKQICDTLYIILKRNNHLQKTNLFQNKKIYILIFKFNNTINNENILTIKKLKNLKFTSSIRKQVLYYFNPEVPEIINTIILKYYIHYFILFDSKKVSSRIISFKEYRHLTNLTFHVILCIFYLIKNISTINFNI